MPPAMSDAMNAATLPVSASVRTRRRWLLLARLAWNCSPVDAERLAATLSCNNIRSVLSDSRNVRIVGAVNGVDHAAHEN